MNTKLYLLLLLTFAAAEEESATPLEEETGAVTNGCSLAEREREASGAAGKVQRGETSKQIVVQ